MFVRASGAVRPATLAELDLAFVEVLFKLGPFVAGGRSVLLAWAQRSTPGEMRLVVAHDVFVEHGVTPCRFDVEVPEERGADVDG